MILLPNQGIKVLSVSPDDGSLESCHGGDLKWSPPVEGPDGSYLPGEWTPPVDPIICHQGYHLTDPKGLVRWFDQSGLRTFLVEYRGKVQGSFDDSDDRKISVESCRLLRPLTDEEHAEHGVFLSGEHTIREGWCCAYGNAGVYAYDNASVWAYDNASVMASGNAKVDTGDNASVMASGNAKVFAYDNVRVNARDNALVYAYDNALVYAYGNSKVEAYGNARVTRNP